PKPTPRSHLLVVRDAARTTPYRFQVMNTTGGADRVCVRDRRGGWARRARRAHPPVTQDVVQAAPLTAKLVSDTLPEWLAWWPGSTDWPVPTEAFQDSLVTVTVFPDWPQMPLHPCTCWIPGATWKVRVQPFQGAPLLVTVRCAT